MVKRRQLVMICGGLVLFFQGPFFAFVQISLLQNPLFLSQLFQNRLFQNAYSQRAFLVSNGVVWAEERKVFTEDDIQESDIKPAGSIPYSQKGADTCLKCHDEDYAFPVLDIFYGVHGNRVNKRSPMAGLQCESCHGPGGLHELEPFVGKPRAPIIKFGRDSQTAVSKQNSMCLQCHADQHRAQWRGSAHQSQAMRCVDCHTLHVPKDPIMQRDTQVDKCFQCHPKQRAEFQRSSVHPVRFGKMQCTQCHNPHGAVAPFLLRNNSSRLCYTCHADKRGPFLWAHAPVSEDCGICHRPHGSVYDALLKKRAPLLCQQCHANGHSSVKYGSDGLAQQTPNAFLLAKSCLNCHFQIHGSNHPSGVKLMR
ncbi:MAG: DmsE family decaheme c-type cytochrome [Gammaproteobacteria bacterium]|nr:DmsE family decaheme c-type cytochrome [Gammaproteobacteria bacterium]MDH5799928.1 DmsE family decaheme c-type cytochrome [Gammaproteobacteria bacterium]